MGNANTRGSLTIASWNLRGKVLGDLIAAVQEIKRDLEGPILD